MKEIKMYFAGSISGGREKRDRYNELIEYCKQFGTVLTEHVGAEDVEVKAKKKYSDKPDEHVYLRDIDWISKSDILIAEVSVPSLGVGYEIAYAEKLGKNILCIYDNTSEKNLSFMISGNSKLNVFRYDNLEEVQEYIETFINNNR